jgi:two-component system nitrate/nitrite response regulator NarL
MPSSVRPALHGDPGAYSPGGARVDVANSPLCELVLTASYPIVLEGLQRRFESEPDVKVVACCSTGADALKAVCRHKPDVLVLDLQIAAHGPFEVLQELTRLGSDTRVVLLADRVSDRETLQAMRLGAKGIMLKAMSSDLLVRCVRKVHAGETWFDRVATGRALDRLVRRVPALHADDRLTDRQLEITKLVVRGLSNREIAHRLAISEGTVKSHLHKLYERLGIRGRVDLVLYSQNRDL